MLLEHIAYPYLKESHVFLLKDKGTVLINWDTERLYFYFSNILVMSLCLCGKKIEFFSSSLPKEPSFIKKVGGPDAAADLNSNFPSSSSMFMKVNSIFPEIKWRPVCQPDCASIIILRFHPDTQTKVCFRNFCICKLFEKHFSDFFQYYEVTRNLIRGCYSKKIHEVFNCHCRWLGHVQVLTVSLD